jgi:hypothetical protein
MSPSPSHQQVLDGVRDFVFEAYPDVPRELVPDDADLYEVMANSLFRTKLLAYVKTQVAPVKVPLALLHKRHFASIAAVAEVIETLRPGDANPGGADEQAAAAQAGGDADQPTTNDHATTDRS